MISRRFIINVSRPIFFHTEPHKCPPNEKLKLQGTDTQRLVTWGFDDNDDVKCEPASGSLLPPGDYVVKCEKGEESCEFSVIIEGILWQSKILKFSWLLWKLQFIDVWMRRDTLQYNTGYSLDLITAYFEQVCRFFFQNLFFGLFKCTSQLWLLTHSSCIRTLLFLFFFSSN